MIVPAKQILSFERGDLILPPLNTNLSPDNILVIKAGNQLNLACDSLGELSALWVEWNALYGVQTVIKFIAHLKRKTS